MHAVEPGLFVTWRGRSRRNTGLRLWG